MACHVFIFPPLADLDKEIPFLFTIVAESFSCIIFWVVEQELLKGFGIGTDEEKVSYRQYASDTHIC